MQRSVKELEALMERMIDANIQVVHKGLDAFELRVFERHMPTIGFTTFQNELTTLRSDVMPSFLLLRMPSSPLRRLR